jgi:hypothetical protein
LYFFWTICGPGRFVPTEEDDMFAKESSMPHAFDRVVDAIDIETCLVARDAEEAWAAAEALLAALGLTRGDIVFLEQMGRVARVRLRAYAHRPGDTYRWPVGEETGNG